jgi:hypothetical protein
VAADLVTLAEFDTWLGGAVAAENDMRTALLEQVEATLERECGRTAIPFRAAQTGRIEKRDGTGGRSLYMDYAINDITSISLGYVEAVTLDPDDDDIVRWAAGSRRITRVDGGTFGCHGSPLLVTVTYDAQADLPADAKIAVLRMAATLYRRRGSEEVKSETMGPYSVTYANAEAFTAADPVWAATVAGHMRLGV